MTRLILLSSSIRCALLCRRPAVSINKISAPFATALFTASNATEAGSLPISFFTIGTPALSLQMVSWSTAAALKVSAAPSMTDLPAALKLVASFPIVVVFPTPFTPTTNTTKGFLPSGNSKRLMVSFSSSIRIERISSCRIPFNSSVPKYLSRATLCCIFSMIDNVVSTPTSAEIMASSN